MSSFDVPLMLRHPAGSSGRRQGEPIRLGIPFPRGVWSGNGDIRLVAEGAAETQVQWKVLERWSDGSCRWALVDFLAATEGPETSGSLRVHNSGRGAPSGDVLVHEHGDDLVVDTAVAQWRLARRGESIFREITVGGVSVINPQQTGLTAVDEGGQPASLSISRVAIEDSGPVRAVVAIEGALRRRDGAHWLSVIIRLHFVRGHAHVEWHVTVRNPRRAMHGNGFWDLGDEGSVFVKDLAVTFACAGSETGVVARCSTAIGRPLEVVGQQFELYQDSSGGENWRSTVHLNRHHKIPVSFRGWRLRTDGGEQQGLRATPIVTLDNGPRSLSLAMRHFWENCPKAIEARQDGLVLRLFPHQYADVHEIQGGEQKTHVFTVAFGADAISAVPLEWHRSPLQVSSTPTWYCNAEAVPYLTPRVADRNDVYLALVDSAIEGTDTFIHKREVIDEYGWRHFGDIYGDHENVFQKASDPPIVSHYNNQYDVVAGFASHFMRSGDWRWWEQMDALAAHVADIDVYHTNEDKSAYNHGLFWHTFHYADADTSTHRSYPRKFSSIVKGGGPSAENNYAAGLMLHYYMTGDPLSREAALALAQFVIDMDDGRKTVFRWLDRGDTGVASSSGVLTYQGPGRGSANSVAALLVGHRLTGDSRFLAKAEQIIRRCIHPDDDIAARDLLDAERRWYYTMFLQSVGGYLDHKAELGQLDERYAYARASLVHYARWMVGHEYPYMQRPEILEYPNETWDAQDMRKSQVFKFAARYTEGEERDRFLERSQFFFDYSTRTLMSKPRHILARPVVLMVTNGFMHAWFQQGRNIDAPKPLREPVSYGRPQAYVPQRVRAIKRARRLVVLGGAATLAAIIAGLALWLS